jgi:putative flippase GtrA
MKLSDHQRRYLAVGGGVYLFELLVIAVSQKLGAGPVLAVGLGFWLGLGVSFFLQKVVTFGDTRRHHQVLLPQLAAFCALVLFNFGFTVGLTGALAPVLPATLSRTLALATTTAWNFYLYKTRIFKNHAGPTVY